jgi:hypothetical protein
VSPLADFIWRSVLPRSVALETFSAQGIEWRVSKARGPRSEAPSDWETDESLESRWTGQSWVVIPRIEGRVSVPGHLRASWNAAFDIVRPLDFTGDGVPDPFAMSYSGGAHCCYTLSLIDTTVRGGGIITIDLVHSGVPVISDLDNDGVEEITIHDWTWDYWKTGFAGAPAPEVILSFKGNTLVARTDLMSRPPPTEQSLVSIAASLSPLDATATDPVDPDLYRHMLDLMYSGNESSAWSLFDLYLPDTFELKTALRAEFIDRLDASPWWPKVRSAAAAPTGTDKPVP